MKKIDLILILPILFLIFISTSIMEQSSSWNQILAYLTLHSTLIILLSSFVHPGPGFLIRLFILIISSGVILLNIGFFQDKELNYITLFSVLFLLNNLFLITVTRRVCEDREESIFKLEHLRYTVLLFMAIFIHLYLFYPEKINITQWWPLSSLFYIPLHASHTGTIYLASFFIAVLIVLSVTRLKRSESHYS